LGAVVVEGFFLAGPPNPKNLYGYKKKMKRTRDLNNEKILEMTFLIYRFFCDG
jgi:hypothetical protein